MSAAARRGISVQSGGSSVTSFACTAPGVEHFLEDSSLKGAWTGPAALDLHPHALAPVAELPVHEVASGLHIVADLTLGLGKVAFDYLS
jgi:acetoacetate decarboxylase